MLEMVPRPNLNHVVPPQTVEGAFEAAMDEPFRFEVYSDAGDSEGTTQEALLIAKEKLLMLMEYLTLLLSGPPSLNQNKGKGKMSLLISFFVPYFGVPPPLTNGPTWKAQR